MLFLAVLENIKTVHYHDDETHIRQLLEKYDLVPNRGTSLAAATVRGLILPSPTRSRSGSYTRRCWKRWCTALAGSYLDKRKAAEMRLFQDTIVSIL